jgi:hypothetical protein
VFCEKKEKERKSNKRRIKQRARNEKGRVSTCESYYIFIREELSGHLFLLVRFHFFQHLPDTIKMNIKKKKKKKKGSLEHQVEHLPR